MKKIIILCIALFSILSARSQMVNVCGNDTIILSVDNYANGIVEWQQSLDTLNWVNIPEAYGTTYKFYPTETKYYRAVVKTSTCTPLYSAISFVQLAPKANAGSDRVVGGTTTILLGNKLTGATGLWTILSGTGGVLTEPTNPYSEFIGTYNQPYQLVWTVTNGCGQSSDTVTVRFEEIIAKNNFIVVDNTDSLYSDSTEMSTGIYRIRFSDATIAPYDSVILIGVRDSMSFLRKVVSFSLQDSIYQFSTIQATFDDLFQNGTITLGDAINQSYLHGSAAANGNKIRSIYSFPTRKTINGYSNNKETFMLYSGGETINTSMQKASAASKEDSLKISFDFPQKIAYEFADGVLKLTLEDMKLSLTPNFVLNYSFNLPHLAFDDYKIGLENGLFDLGFKLKLEATSTLLKKEKPFEFDLTKPFKKVMLIMVGPVPLPSTLNFKVNGSLSMDIEAGITYILNQNYNNKFSAFIQSENSETPKLEFKSVETSTKKMDLTINGGLNGEFKIGPELSFKFGDLIGPYVKLPVKIGLELKANSDLNWSGEASLGLEGLLGVKAETDEYKALGYTVLDKATLFDYNFSLWGDKLTVKEEIPYKLELISGNNQQGQNGVLLPKPVVFKVTDSFGVPIPFVRVRFNVDAGNGNVAENVLVTDISGQVSMKWTPGSNAINVLKASVLDYENQDIENSPITVNAFTTSDYKSCENSDLSITIKSTQTSKYPFVTGGVAPYSYSTNGVDYSTQVPYFNLSTPRSFAVTVKDNNQCSVVKTIVVGATNPCKNTDLTMDIVNLSNTLKITGRKGIPPYQYAVDSQTGFTSFDFFANLTSGIHTVYVQDANSCIVSKTVMINSLTLPAIKATYPINGASSVSTNNMVFSWIAGNYTGNQVYDIYLKSGNSDYSIIGTNLITPTFAYSGSLTNSTTYTWKVVVKSNSGLAINFSEFTFSTVSGSNTLPYTPVLSFPSNGRTVLTPVTLKWTPQAGDFKYDVYCDANNATTLVATNLTNAEFTVNKLTENKTYYWKVKIKSTVTGQSQTSEVWSFSTLTPSLTTGLVAYYPFNGNANDASGNGNNGTVNGARLTTDRFGNVGKAYNFDGVSNYIKVPNSNSIDITTNQISMCAWVKISNGSYTNQILSKAQDVVNRKYGMYVGHNNETRLGFELKTSNGVTDIISENIPIEQWHYVTETYDGKNLLWYIDGVIIKTLAWTGDIVSTTTDLSIGCFSDLTRSFFKGNLDNIRIYNRALSSEEVSQLYNSEKPAPDIASGLVAYYPFNGNANDESGNGNNGTVNDATLTTDRFGNVGKAYSFDGVSNNISFSKVPMQNTDNWCISTWAKTNTLDNIQTILMLGVDNGLGGSSHNGYSLGIGYTGTISSFVSIFSDIAPINSGAVLSINQWYNLIIQRVNGVTNFYINGVKTNSTSAITPRTPTEFFIGSSTGIRYFNGIIDDVRIYNRTLSSDEITQLYNSEKPVSPFGTFTDSRDGHIYKTITIGTQTWMAENLAYLPVTPSEPSVGLEDETDWMNKTTPYYYSGYNVAKYGVLYNYYAALTAAPDGWRLPCDDDWNILSNYLGGENVAGGKMKTTVDWLNPNIGASNSSLFTAQPSGYRYWDGLINESQSSYWWSSTSDDAGHAYDRYLYYNNEIATRFNDNKYYGFSVRCIKN
ncbi:MAG: LamG-like jellyroll fold domain-containing protein [Paludibacter sp.]